MARAAGPPALPPAGRIGAVHDFVRDTVRFGYSCGDALPASAVLADGYGQGNTKATLMMALLRGLGIRCRLHGFTTSIQRTGINRDLGTFANPDDFSAAHRQLRGFRGWLFRVAVRHWMNLRLAGLRRGLVPKIPGDGR